MGDQLCPGRSPGAPQPTSQRPARANHRSLTARPFCTHRARRDPSLQRRWSTIDDGHSNRSESLCSYALPSKGWSTYGAKRAQPVATGRKRDDPENGSNRPIGNRWQSHGNLPSFDGKGDRLLSAVEVSRCACPATGCPRLAHVAGARTGARKGNSLQICYFRAVSKTVPSRCVAGFKSLPLRLVGPLLAKRPYRTRVR